MTIGPMSDMSEPSQNASALVPTPLTLQELPPGWHPAEPDDWGEAYPASRRRAIVVRVTAAALLVAAVVGVLVWVAAGHYARGVEALDDGAYYRAMGEFSSATLLGIPYRDAGALEDQARRELRAETAAREAQDSLVGGVVGRLGKADARLAAGDAAGVLTALESIPAGDLRTAMTASENARASAAALAEGLSAAATKALGKAEWSRAGRLAAALLVLEPSSRPAAALAARAGAGEKLRAKLGEARSAARAGRWREALRLALAVVAARKDFPGAATLVADARRALAPKPKPKPAVATAVAATPAPPVQDTGGSSNAAPPAPAPP